MFFLFKQKTAYEMRISDWSSDVCSSDLPIEGVDFESFTKDPLFQSFQKAAHAKGMTNEQLQFVTERYIELAPQLFSADKSLSADEAKAELGKLWADDTAMKSNLASRSEEHTSELQSLMRISYAVFCLKKKTKTNNPK